MAAMDLKVMLISVFVVIVATVCVTCALTVPGGYSATETGGYKKGQAMISRTAEYGVFAVCFSISFPICIAVAAIHTMVDGINDETWLKIVFATKYLAWLAGVLASVGIVQFVTVSIGNQPGLKGAVQGLFYGILALSFTTIIILRWKHPKT